jgi:hypothetical protein
VCTLLAKGKRMQMENEGIGEGLSVGYLKIKLATQL